jgi:hypothetical protein
MQIRGCTTMTTPIVLLIAGITSLSLSATPAPVNWRSTFHFLQLFFLFSAMVVGIAMTLPLFMEWQLPFQQGLGTSAELMVRGALLSVACLFCVLVTSMQAGGALPWIKAVLLLILGASEFSRVWDFMDFSINAMLEYSDMPMKHLYSLIYPYILLLASYVILAALGLTLLIMGFYKAYRKT